MTVQELNSLPYLSANLDRILQYLEADTTVPAWFIPMETATDPMKEVLQGELPALMAEFRRLTGYIDGMTDPQMKYIFELRFIEQRSLREIGQEYGITSNTLKQQIYSYLRLNPEGYHSCKELAAIWDLNINTVNNWCRLGLLPGAKKRGKQRWIIPHGAVLPQRRHK